jgi:hypothetical protein
VAGSGAANAAGKQRGRPFVKGQSGNPAGKKTGTRHAVTWAVEMLLEGEAEALTRKAVSMALAGDTVALRLCLDRIAPPRREALVEIELPKITSPMDLPGVAARLVEATARGEIAPGEARSLATLLESYRKQAELADIEARLRALEDRANVER